MKVANGLADFYLCALCNENLESAIRFRKNLGGDFIGFDFKQGVPRGNGVPIFAFPRAKYAGGDGFADRWNANREESCGGAHFFFFLGVVRVGFLERAGE